jgi:RNA polymerase sigma-70 factor (ECF subfamily)
MPWLTEDRARLEAFRRGEADILAQTYDVYALPLAERLARGVSVDRGAQRLHFGRAAQPHELAEVVQETFIRAFSPSARQRYDGLRPFASYLLSIARNLIVDAHRSRVRHDRWEERARAVVDETGAEQPDTALIDVELRQIYARFVEGLDETGKQVCQMRFTEQLPRRQVCAATGLTLMQVRHLEERLRGRLFRLLVAAGYGEADALLLLLALTALVEQA